MEEYKYIYVTVARILPRGVFSHLYRSLVLVFIYCSACRGNKKVVGLERGPLSLVSKIEELLERKVAALVYKTENTAVGSRHADHVVRSIRKS
jgi:hypothetical protein